MPFGFSPMFPVRRKQRTFFFAAPFHPPGGRPARPTAPAREPETMSNPKLQMMKTSRIQIRVRCDTIFKNTFFRSPFLHCSYFKFSGTSAPHFLFCEKRR